MQTRLQRICAVFTAMAVLAVSFNCVCAGMTPAANAGPMPCCAHHHQGQHCKHRSSKSSPCSAGCEHCTQTAVNDTVANPSQHVDQVSWHSIAGLMPQFDLRVVSDADTTQCFAASAGFPPPANASTLLSLHCALII